MCGNSKSVLLDTRSAERIPIPGVYETTRIPTAGTRIDGWIDIAIFARLGMAVGKHDDTVIAMAKLFHALISLGKVGSWVRLVIALPVMPGVYP